MTEALGYFFISWFDPWLVFLIAVGTFAGIYIGAIPGLSVTMAVSILISFTFAWEVNDALCLMVGIFMGGVYGGSRTAILLNIPGAPSAIATALDGYPLALKGEAGEAIGISTIMSVLGGFVGILALAAFAPVISDFALTFQPRDFMLLGLLGHPAARLALGREPGQGHRRRRARAADRHRGPRPADRRGALHLRHHRALERHLVHRGDDRPVRRRRGAGAAPPARPAGDQAEDRPHRAVLGVDQEVLRRCRCAPRASA